MGEWCLLRPERPREQGGVDTRWRWLILSMFGRGPVWLGRMTERGPIGRGVADVEGLAGWDRSV